MLTLGRNRRLGQEHPPLPKQSLASALSGPLGNQRPPSAKEEPSCNTLQADCDINIKLMRLSDKDFLVVHKNSKGLWKDELWTLRDFDAFEIQLGPFSPPNSRRPTSW